MISLVQLSTKTVQESARFSGEASIESLLSDLRAVPIGEPYIVREEIKGVMTITSLDGTYHSEDATVRIIYDEEGMNIEVTGRPDPVGKVLRITKSAFTPLP